MPAYRITHRRQSRYGESVGILILKAAYPCVPGTIDSATTFDFAVRCKAATGRPTYDVIPTIRHVHSTLRPQPCRVTR